MADVKEVSPILEKSPEQFYTDYLKFIKSSPELGDEIEYQVYTWYRKAEEDSFGFNSVSDLQIHRMEEGLGLFFYGIELAKRLQPKLTKDIPEPKYVGLKRAPNLRGYHSNFAEYVPELHEVLLSALRFDLAAFDDEKDKYSPVISNEYNQKSILSAHLMGDVVIASVEEYAHYIFDVIKDATPEEKERYSKELKEGYTLEIYKRDQYWHQASRVEFSAVIWKTALVRRFMPWMQKFQDVAIHLMKNVRPYRVEFLKKRKAGEIPNY